jgi:flagellar assembly factor FliW
MTIDNTPIDTNTVTFQSTRFGELEVPKDSIIHLPQGVIGFPSFTQFVMLDYKAPFSWLHSVEKSDLAFVVIDGFLIEPNYDPSLAYKEVACEFREEDEYAVILIVTVRSKLSETTANLKAPIFVNLRNRKGVQVVFDDQQYLVRFPLYSAEDDKTGAVDGSILQDNK